MNRFHRAVAERATYRCEYCHAPEELFNGTFDVDHVRPRSRGGTDALGNLALSCEPCNTYKSDAVDAPDPDTGDSAPLFNPRFEFWADHFRVLDDEIVVGTTPTGRATVSRLRLNAPRQVHARGIWRSVNLFP